MAPTKSPNSKMTLSRATGSWVPRRTAISSGVAISTAKSVRLACRISEGRVYVEAPKTPWSQTVGSQPSRASAALSAYAILRPSEDDPMKTVGGLVDTGRRYPKGHFEQREPPSRRLSRTSTGARANSGAVYLLTRGIPYRPAGVNAAVEWRPGPCREDKCSLGDARVSRRGGLLVECPTWRRSTQVSPSSMTFYSIVMLR